MHLRMPKDLSDYPHRAALEDYLKATQRLLRSGSEVTVSYWSFDARIAQALRGILHTGHVVQGLEHISEVLDREKKGLDALEQRSGQVPASPRLARLLLLSNDGSDRFLREAAALLVRHGARAYGIVLDTDAVELGQLSTKKGNPTKALLIDDRKVLASFLKAIGDQLPMGEAQA